MRQTALTLAVRLIIVFFGLISSIATARFLGPEGRGIFFYWSTIAALIVQFGNFGLHASNTYLHARRDVDFAVLAANSMVASIAAGTMLSGIVLGVLYLIGGESALSVEVWLAIVLLSIGGLYILLGANLLVAMGRITQFNFLELFNRGLLLFILLFALLAFSDPYLLLLSVGAGTICAAGITFWCLVQYAAPRRPSWQVFRSGFSYGARAYFVAGLGALMARLNAFLLEPYIPADDYGAWSIAAQMTDMMLLVPQSIALVLLPHVMRSKDPTELVRKRVLMTFLAMLALMVAFLMVGQPVVTLLYGDAFSAAFSYVMWGMPGLLALSLISILSQYLAAVGIPVALIALWAIVTAVHGTLASVLIPVHGAAGAMASQSVGYVMALVLVILLMKVWEKKGGQHDR